MERILTELRAGRDPGRPGFVGHTYSEIHEAWLDRNPNAEEEQWRLFPDLSEYQKSLDRDVYHEGLALIDVQLQGLGRR
ncbi:hypothetical protein ACLMAL_02325 [Nocardia sp. CWNU-33]|uniref:hypothetical protein n=1 Tax=Nocardia sp. CWNU-33 TaxID=3392117 RepID=UPI00398F3F33